MTRHARTCFKRSAPLTMYVVVVCYLAPWVSYGVSGVKNITYGVARHLRSIGFPEGSGTGVKYRNKSFIFHRLMPLSITDTHDGHHDSIFFIGETHKILNKSKEEIGINDSYVYADILRRWSAHWHSRQIGAIFSVFRSELRAPRGVELQLLLGRVESRKTKSGSKAGLWYSY